MVYVRSPLTQPNLLKYVMGLGYFHTALTEIVAQIIHSVTILLQQYGLSATNFQLQVLFK